MILQCTSPSASCIVWHGSFPFFPLFSFCYQLISLINCIQQLHPSTASFNCFTVFLFSLRTLLLRCHLSKLQIHSTLSRPSHPRDPQRHKILKYSFSPKQREESLLDYRLIQSEGVLKVVHLRRNLYQRELCHWDHQEMNRLTWNQ